MLEIEVDLLEEKPRCIQNSSKHPTWRVFQNNQRILAINKFKKKAPS